MKVGFVAEPYEESHASGMGYVIIETLRELVKQNTEHAVVVYSSTPINRTLIPGVYENVLVPKTFLGKVWWFSRLRDVDVLIHMVALLPLWVPKRVKTLLLCQELADQHVPSREIRQKLIVFIRDSLLMPRCVARASKIIAASNATKKDIEKFYCVPPEKIVVAYDGFQNLKVFGTDFSLIQQGMEPFFFFAGRVKRRKNVHAIVSALIRFRERTGVVCNVVIAGGHGGAYDQVMLDELAQHQLSEALHFVGYVTTEQLHALYLRCIAFVFPSISEGFGMPLAEAMSLGVPVITSNISAMPEVVGDAGVLVDPYDIDDLSRAMEKVFMDETYRASLITKGIERAGMFSWEKAARSIINEINALHV